mgnify:CR=1 FL=1
MRKFTISLLILLCLSFNIITLMPLAAGNVFKEGFYKASEFNISPTSNYTIQNISSTDSAYVLVFDNNKSLYQSVRLEPNSPKYGLLSIEPDFRIVIVGKGEIFIA